MAQQKLPGQSRVWAAIGWIKRRQGKFNDANVNMTKAFELDPRSASIAYNIADTHRYLRNFAEAERWYDRASLLNPDWLGPYWRKGVLYVAWDGDTTEACAVLDEWRARADSTYRDYTIELLWARRYAEALEWLSADPCEFFQVFPDLNDARIPKELEYARVSAFLNLPQQAFAYYDSARAVLEAKLLDQPNDERLHSALGIAYAGLGRKESAIRQGRIGVALMPLEKEAAWKGLSRLEQLAQIYTLVGDYDAAIGEIEHLLSIPSWVTVPLLRIDPTYYPLRDHTRFQELLEEYE